MNIKGNENTKERRRKEEHLHYTTLKERNPSNCSPCPRLRSIHAVFIGIGRMWKARRGYALKIDAWPTKLPQQLGGTAVKLGPIALNFGHVVRLASSTFYMYLVLQCLNIYLSRFSFKYGNPRCSSRSSFSWYSMLIYVTPRSRRYGDVMATYICEVKTTSRVR